VLKMNNTLEPVKAVSPVAAYLGGKRCLAKRINARIEAVNHNRYVEPFVGMGGIFLRRSKRPQQEVINDVSTDVTNLFRILQRHYPQFLDTLKWQLGSRAEFERLRETNPETLTDLERAARFLYLQKMGFGGMPRNFGIQYSYGSRFDLTKLVSTLEDVHERLAGVIIECLPYGECIKRYDSRPGTLFYCDPPYWGCEDDYGKNIFSPDDFVLLRDILEGINGRFIMSINDVPDIRDLFKRFDIQPVELNYRVSGNVTPAKELIISN
jgi:DNA adenine methylase